MTQAHARTLFAVMLDFPREYEDAANRWFDGDHVPQRLSCAGFRGCERYQLTDIEPPGWTPQQRWFKYVNFYDIESPAVLDSEAYKLQGTSARNSETASPLEAGNPRIQHLRRQYRALGRGEFRQNSRSLRTLWSLRASPWSVHSAVSLPAPRSLLIVLRDIDATKQVEANRSIDSVEVPELLSCPGFIRCERYQALPMRHTGGLAEPQPAYMDVYDLATPEVATSDRYWQYFNARARNTDKILASIAVRGCGVYLQRPSPWAAVPGH